jgi:hypothetical protein
MEFARLQKQFQKDMDRLPYFKTRLLPFKLDIF